MIGLLMIITAKIVYKQEAIILIIFPVQIYYFITLPFSMHSQMYQISGKRWLLRERKQNAFTIIIISSHIMTAKVPLLKHQIGSHFNRY